MYVDDICESEWCLESDAAEQWRDQDRTQPDFIFVSDDSDKNRGGEYQGWAETSRPALPHGPQ